MCGFLGILDPKQRWAAPALQAAFSTLAHRGPDDRGELHWPPLHLFHHRLSVIDLSPGGHQPMTDEGEEVALVFNGEIYNFAELRAGLEKRGHRFRSRSDTEVILRLYRERGEAFVEQLDGMFALALYDRRQGTLLLARDRFGKKPLYYTRLGETLAFASEIKALLRLPSISRELDPAATYLYFLFQFIPAPRTIFRQVCKLPPGTLLVQRGETAEERRYFHPGRLPPAPPAGFDLDHLESLLLAAVKKRLVADVPLGLFLSGGIDSSLLLALMTRLRGGAVKTFTIAFPQAAFDESPYAREAARLFGSEHREIPFPHCDEELWRRTLWHLDEPLADAAALPTMILSRFAAREVKVVLSGEGADELFAGYPCYLYEYGLRRAAALPGVHAAAQALARLLADHFSASLPHIEKIRFILDSDPRLGINRWRLVTPPPRLAALLAPPLQQAIRLQPLLSDLAAWAGPQTPPLEALFPSDLLYWLPENLMMKVDKTTMAYGLEARAPFLDLDLFGYLSRLPTAVRLGTVGRKKALLKPLALRYLPRRLVRRPKHGFMNPIAEWMETSLYPLCQSLAESAPPELFQRSAVTRLWNDFLAGRKGGARLLWQYFCFRVWQEEMTGRSSG